MIEKKYGHSTIDIVLTICILILSLHRLSQFFLGVEGCNCSFFLYCPWDNAKKKKSADSLTDTFADPLMCSVIVMAWPSP